ncbi:MAG TPA: tetratricopeptide repeat protein, partial [Gemmataceae bacterium]|nr:tetratricopeptide repeat protein [Gemmataceae bacterium]
QIAPVRRKVALKVLKPGMDAKQVVARFEAERQALALMDHPNIARVLDAGTAGAGRPYFVMELVKGVPITRFCDERRLTPRQRLELFIPVCQAVQHAHQKGVIHRDLKPSNVLVAPFDGNPVVKVIDFGVAKAAGQPLTEKTLFTGFAQMVGTPLYMSPEQAGQSGLDVDTRSDIYSLGVLLYELLTGTTPFERERLQGVGYDELRRIIREEDPPRPSTRISTLGQAATTLSAQRRSDPRQLTRLVRGELDWVVMKALEKDRNRRYESASAFAADVQHYLHDEPVLACPPSAWYRCRKFARRNEGVLGIAGLVLVFLLLLGGGSGWVLRDRAVRHAAAGQQARESLSRARAWLREDKLALARQELAEAKGHIGNERAALQDLAEEIDALDATMARFQRFVDLVEQAHDAETRLTLRLAPSEPEGGTSSAPAPGSDPASDPADAVSFRLQALSCYQVMERDDWVAALEQSLGQPVLVQQVRRTVYEELLWLTGDVLRRAQNYRSGGKLSAAEAARHGLLYLHKAEQAWRPTWALYHFRARCHTALGEKEAAAADQASVRNTPPAMAIDHYLRGLAARDAKDKAEAVKQLEAALRLEPTHYWSLKVLGNCLVNLSERREDYAAAAVAFTGCILRRPEDPLPYQARSVAYARLGRYEEALADASRSIELKPDFADAWNSRGIAYECLCQYDRAAADFAKAIGLKPEETQFWVNRGVAYEGLRQYDRAAADFARAIELKPNEALPWRNRGRLYSTRGQYEKALADFSRAIDLKPDDAAAWYDRGNAYKDWRRYDRAVADYSRAIELKPDETALWVNRGVAYDYLRQYAKAVADFSRAIELKPEDASLWYNRGDAYRCSGQQGKALADLSKSIELKADDPKEWDNRGLVHAALGQYDKAIADHSKAIELQPDYVPPWINRGWAYAILRQYDKAIADYSKAIELKPDDSAAWDKRGDAYRRLGQRERAIADYAQASLLAPADSTKLDKLARLLATYPEVDRPGARRALAAAQKAVQGSPRSAAAWQALGWAHYRAGDWKPAIEALEKSCTLQEDPKGGDPAQWFFLAMAHWQLGEKDQAHAWYAKATAWVEQQAPGNDELLGYQAEAAQLLGIAGLARGRFYAERGQWDKAEAEFEAAAAGQPKNAAGLFSFGATCARFGRWDKADAAYRRGLELDPSDHMRWVRAAVLQLYTGDVEGYRRTRRAMLERFGTTDKPEIAERTAKVWLLLPDSAADIGPVLKLADRAVAGNEKHRYYWYFMLCQGLAAYRAGRYPAAAEWLKRAPPGAHRPGHEEIFAPHDAMAFAVLSLAQHGLGREAEARAALGEARDILAKWLPDPGKGRPFEDNWQDWLQCRILCREAEALLPKETANRKQETTEKAKAATRK